MGQRVTFKPTAARPDGYPARPKGNGPGIIVFQEGWGLVPHIENIADRFAAEGFLVLAPDLFHPREGDVPDQAGKLMMSLSIDEAGTDLGCGN